MCCESVQEMLERHSCMVQPEREYILLLAQNLVLNYKERRWLLKDDSMDSNQVQQDSMNTSLPPSNHLDSSLLKQILTSGIRKLMITMNTLPDMLMM